jgi:hypothetical protein
MLFPTSNRRFVPNAEAVVVCKTIYPTVRPPEHWVKFRKPRWF